MVPMSVSADMGPKPSVVVDFIGLEDEVYYVTLLSEDTSTGPWSLGNEYYEYMGDEAAFEKFCEYEDVDGYYFPEYYFAFIFHYVWMECVVFIIEAVIFDKVIGRVNKATNKKYHPYLYALVANIVSFMVGMCIAKAIPGFFLVHMV